MKSNVEYKDIEGFPGYKIGTDGTVLSNKRGKGYINSFKGASGYMLAVLYNNGKRSTVTLHRLLAKAFIPNPNNYDCINHKDENRLNNDLSNLEWCSRSYNRKYGTCEERRVKTLSATRAITQFSMDGHLLNIYPSCAAAAKSLNLKSTAAVSIGKCAHGKSKYSHGYIWKMVKNRNLEVKSEKEITETMENLYDELMPILASYKTVLEKEYKNLNKDNKNWRKEHGGEDCESSIMKMWAISAPYTTLDIIKHLYLDKK